MAGPTYGASGSYYENSSTTPSVGAPSGVAADSVVVFVAYVDGAADPVITAGSGWAHAPGSPVYEDDDPLDGTSQNHRIAIVWHRASGSESGPYGPITLGSGQFISGQVHRFEGCVTSGDPFDTAFDVAGKTISDTNSPPVAITTGGADELVLHAATNWAGGPWTPSSGFTERQDGGTFHHSMLAEKAQAAAGSTGSVVSVATGSNKSQAWLGALLPASTTDTGALAGTTVPASGALAGTVSQTGALAGTTVPTSGALAGSVFLLGAAVGSTPPAVGALAGTVVGAGALAASTSLPVGALRQASAVAGPIRAGAVVDHVIRPRAGTPTS